ncbi:hypothetical protein Taro_045471 [Colocasia esculenta]|uniref:Uncharacterized protein n=1 Tax=Colocasia esculenta TaxID=4460 RepID=A0A843WM65_COLES|nr:hypothetical protein [Colocasia esculenta]
MSHCDNARYTDVGWYNHTATASRGRRGGAPAREDEPRRDERAEQQAPAPQGPVLPPPPPMDYGVFMQGLVQAMQMQAHTQAALQAQLEAQFWPKARLASISTDVDVVSASTMWTPTLTPASSDVDANFSDQHALQSPEFRKQASSPIGELSLTIRELGASSGHLQRRGDSWSIREGFPDLALVSTSIKDPKEGVFGGFLGLPKEGFTTILDPFGELGVNALDAEIHGVRPAILSSTPRTARDRRQTHYLLRRIGVVGDDTLAEEAVETDSERGD